MRTLHKSYYQLLLRLGDRMARSILPGKPARGASRIRKGNA